MAKRCVETCDFRVCNIYDKNYVFSTEVTGVSDRKITDVVCCIVMLLLIIGDFILIQVGVDAVDGDMDLLLSGYDYNGIVCTREQRCSWYDPVHAYVRYCLDSKQCNDTAYSAINYQDRFCVPDYNDDVYRALYYDGPEPFKLPSTYSETFVDLISLWIPIVVVTVVGSILLSIFYLLAITYNLRLWAYLLLNFTMGTVLAILILAHGVADWDNPLNRTHTIIETVIASLFFFFMCMMAIWFYRNRKQLLTEIEMMAEARQVIFELFVPIAGFAIFLAIVICAFYTLWSWQIVEIYSAMKQENEAIPEELVADGVTNAGNEYVWYASLWQWKLCMLLHAPYGVFMMFWFGSFAYLVIAHTVLVEYLGKDQHPFTYCVCCGFGCRWSAVKTPTGVQRILESIGTVFKYHLGTAAFSALLSTALIPSVPQFFFALFKWSKQQIATCRVKLRLQNQRRLLSQQLTADAAKAVELQTRKSSVSIDTQITKEMEQNEKRLELLRDAMYNDLREELLPLIRAKIMHAAHDTITSALLDQKLEDVYVKYETGLQVEHSVLQAVEEDRDDEKYEQTAAEKEKEAGSGSAAGSADFIEQFKLQAIAEKLQHEGITADFLASQTDEQIDAISKELTDSMIQQNKFKYAVQQIKNGPANPKSIPKLSADVLKVIEDNIHRFEFEQLIKDDVYAVIDAHIHSLDKSQKAAAATGQHSTKLSFEELQQRAEAVLRVRTDVQQTAESDAAAAERKKSKEILVAYDVSVIPDIKLFYSDLSKDALVFTALYGQSLTYSAFRSKALKRLNETRLSVEGSMNYSEMFGRLGISITNAAILAICLTVIEKQPNNTSISAIWAPCFIVLVITFAISNLFTLVFEAIVQSLLYCVLLNESRWSDRFHIDEERIKNRVKKMGSGLTSMLAEHLLIMQLREKEVNKKLNEMCVDIERIGAKENLSALQIKLAQDKLRRAKRTALETERALLNSIDGPMKLTEYLINVILVENYFNHQYKDKKLLQENARREYAQKYFEDQARNLEYVSKADMKARVKVPSFLSYFPVSDSSRLERAWSLKIDRVVKTLQGSDKQYKFKMTGAKQKNIERAFYKSFYGYHDKPDGYMYLTDVLRCSFVFHGLIGFDHLYQCFADLMEMKDEFEVIRVKDRFNEQSQPCGYRDLMMNVLCRAKTENEKCITGIICEIQLHHNIFYDAKKVSHRMYKKTRLFEKDNGNKAYEYAKMYIRPILGRFKTYEMDGDERGNKKKDNKDSENILNAIDQRIQEMADKYSQDYVIDKLKK